MCAGSTGPEYASAEEALEDAKDKIREHDAELAQLFERHSARYKLEIMFSHKRSTTEPTAGIVSVWESNSEASVEGDGRVYWCPSASLGRGTCAAVIPSKFVNYGKALCPTCKQVWDSEEVVGEIFGRWTMQGWAKKITQLFLALGSNADVYVKQPKYDIRGLAQEEQEKVHRGERLAVGRGSIVRYIYPLARIVQDTQAGADLENRFYAFLRS